VDAGSGLGVFRADCVEYCVEGIGAVARGTARRVGMVYCVIAFEYGGNFGDCVSFRGAETEVLGTVS